MELVEKVSTSSAELRKVRNRVSEVAAAAWLDSRF